MLLLTASASFGSDEDKMMSVLLLMIMLMLTLELILMAIDYDILTEQDVSEAEVEVGEGRGEGGRASKKVTVEKVRGFQGGRHRIWVLDGRGGCEGVRGWGKGMEGGWRVGMGCWLWCFTCGIGEGKMGLGILRWSGAKTLDSLKRWGSPSRSR